MREELETKLENEFDFMKINKCEDKTPYSMFGIECDDGWYILLQNLCQEITDRYAQDNEPIDIKVDQIKEKFASLCFYYSFVDAPCPIQGIDFLGNGVSIRLKPQQNENIDERKEKLRNDIAQIVEKYENKSEYICESCGNSGVIRNLPRNWLKTLCDTCYEKQIKNMGK